ncbi:hypothetical protein SPSYN_02973 [Sporotomaculum syntrophicum]|uniref:Uncharacterized protein n=1 Tax=Sporotomaculum syntrophicum TaxID=182264 RepID=A0A9D3AWI4_9FIRM|nr:hypothetical protein [Sporotomaculum syntrophicum]KAF1083817.1 hypothetical protein SPSYN_02973 [Sporotomaculum syntrophicum]
MGIRCTCGVFTTIKAFATDVNVQFVGVPGTVRGNLRYIVNACVDFLEASTLTLVFTQTESGPPDRSFTFEASKITCTNCLSMGNTCVVTVAGEGTGGRTFFAEFRDTPDTAANDLVQSFMISGFFNQGGAVPVPQGSIISVGC